MTAVLKGDDQSPSGCECGSAGVTLHRDTQDLALEVRFTHQQRASQKQSTGGKVCKNMPGEVGVSSGS